MPEIPPDQAELLAQVDAAAGQSRLSAGAALNIRAWLVEPRYAEMASQVAALIRQCRWKELDDAFWTVIPFGTGGRRGRMYPVGSNTINDRTIGESARGLAEYVREHAGPGRHPGCAIGYDTRHRSRHFAELCAEVMAAAGLQVYFLDGYRSTPELSMLVRHKQCACGIMVTASHNPPSDNAVKVYWSGGGQVLPPHDRAIIQRVMQVGAVERMPFERALSEGRVVYCQEEMDRVYQSAVAAQAFAGPRDVKILYSPLHGVGAQSVVPILAAAGFRDVEVFAGHASPDGDFPNVPGHVANPENPEVFEALIERARQSGADVILATDPDADRLGCAAPAGRGGAWQTLTGNQMSALLAEYVCQRRQAAGTLGPEHFVVTTLVTTRLVERIAESYGIRTIGNLHVGFKWIVQAIDQHGPERFVYATEESHGFLIGTHVRDKDGNVAALAMAGLAAELKASGQTFDEKLDALYWQHGCHVERTVSQMLPGSKGMVVIERLMARLRQQPPTALGGLKVSEMRDYLCGQTVFADGRRQGLDAPAGDMVMLDLELEGNYVAVRPSGTEPKVKFYVFTYEPPELLADLDDAKAALAARADAVLADLRAYAGA